MWKFLQSCEEAYLKITHMSPNVHVSCSHIEILDLNQQYSNWTRRDVKNSIAEQNSIVFLKSNTHMGLTV